MATPFGADDHAVVWTNRAGESATVSTRVTWLEDHGSFVSPPSVTVGQAGGLTFSVFWANSEILRTYRDGDHECVHLRIKFSGQFRCLFVFKLPLVEITEDYVVCADGSGTIRRL